MDDLLIVYTSLKLIKSIKKLIQGKVARQILRLINYFIYILSERWRLHSDARTLCEKHDLKFKKSQNENRGDNIKKKESFFQKLLSIVWVRNDMNGLTKNNVKWKWKLNRFLMSKEHGNWHQS